MAKSGKNHANDNIVLKNFVYMFYVWHNKNMFWKEKLPAIWKNVLEYVFDKADSRMKNWYAITFSTCSIRIKKFSSNSMCWWWRIIINIKQFYFLDLKATTILVGITFSNSSKTFLFTFAYRNFFSGKSTVCVRVASFYMPSWVFYKSSSTGSCTKKFRVWKKKTNGIKLNGAQSWLISTVDECKNISKPLSVLKNEATKAVCEHQWMDPTLPIPV